MDLNQIFFHHQIMRMAAFGQLLDDAPAVVEAWAFARMVTNYHGREASLGALAAGELRRLAGAERCVS